MFRKIRRYFRSPYYSLGHDLMKKYPNWMNDRYFIRIMWKDVMGTSLNLKNPITFNEKLQWMKLYDRNPLYTMLVDKYKVKDWVSARIGKEYVIRTLSVYDSVNDIDFDKLPEQFVLKCNHDSGGIVICKDKSRFDIPSALHKLKRHFEHNYYLDYREWPYKNVERKIFAEEYIEDVNTNGFHGKCGEKCDEWEGLRDYKFFCFDGQPKIMYVSSDKAKYPTTDFFDMDGNVLPIRMQDPPSAVVPSLPNHFDEMYVLAQKLSEGLREVRVDFYEANNHVYFGEMTFFHAGGLCEVKPVEWNIRMGNWINLNK